MTTLDPRHVAAVERAMTIDRGYAETFPAQRRRVREPIAHELCPPGYPCLDVSGWYVETIFVTDGLRARRLVRLPASGAA